MLKRVLNKVGRQSVNVFENRGVLCKNGVANTTMHCRIHDAMSSKPVHRGGILLYILVDKSDHRTEPRDSFKWHVHSSVHLIKCVNRTSTYFEAYPTFEWDVQVVRTHCVARTSPIIFRTYYRTSTSIFWPEWAKTHVLIRGLGELVTTYNSFFISLP